MTSDNKKKHWLGNIFKYGLSFGLSAVFLYIAFQDVDFQKVMMYVSDASVFWIVVFVSSLMFAHFLRAIRWKIILRSVKKDTSLLNLFGALMVGYGVNCVVPRLGEVSRAVVLGKWEKLSRSSMLGTVFLERVIDVIFLGLTVFVTEIIWVENLNESFPWLESALYLTAIGLIGIILLLYLTIRFKEKFYGFIIKFIGRFSQKAAEKVAYIFDMLTVGFASLKGTKNYIWTIILSVLIMLTYALSSFLGFYTVGMQHIKPVTFEMGWVLMSISAIGVVIPTPGAIGSYHALAKKALVALFGFGESISLAYAFLTHIISYIIFVITSLLFFFFLNKYRGSEIKIVEKKTEKK